MTALDRLKQDKRWVAWRYLQRGQRKTKPPVDPHTGRAASVADEETWGTYEQAWDRKQRDNLPGVGYVLREDSGIVGADLDHVRNAETGVVEPWAQDIINLRETYCEVSPSGEGLRFFMLGTLANAIKNDAKNVELYTKDRYLTITGQRVPGCPDEIREAPQTLAALLARANEGKVEIKKGLPQESTTDDDEDTDDGEAVPNGNGRQRAEDAWDKLNTAALHNLSAWVPALFGSKAKPSPRGGYRIPPRALGRDYEEDISITSSGIVDFAVADQGDPRKGKRTPIALVMEHKGVVFDDAVTWLCHHLGVTKPGTVLDPQDPMRSARAFHASRFMTKEELSILHRYHEEFWIWRQNCYKQTTDEIMHSAIWRYLENGRRLTQKGIKPFKPKLEHVSNIFGATKAVTAMDPFLKAPCWIREEDNLPPPTELFACANGLLHVPTRQVYDSTPNYFNTTATTFNYDESAAIPERWMEFLQQVLRHPDERDLLQEWFGYLLVADTSMQKILFCLGGPRCGKSTVGRMITHLLGKDSVANPTIATFSQTYGLADMVDKLAAVVTDARVGTHTDKAALIERLLSISGEDSLTVARKYLSAINLRLLLRLTIITNEIPALIESSGALIARYLLLNFPESFVGREDRDLERKLRKELPGMLNWALDGHDRLMARGHFVQPASSEEVLEEMLTVSSPVAAFIRDRCELGQTFEVSVDELYDRYKAYSSTNSGGMFASSKEWFGRNLRAAKSGISIVKRGPLGNQRRYYVGIRPMTGAEGTESSGGGYREPDRGEPLPF